MIVAGRVVRHGAVFALDLLKYDSELESIPALLSDLPAGWWELLSVPVASGEGTEWTRSRTSRLPTREKTDPDIEKRPSE